MKKFAYIFLLFAAAVATGCNPADKFSVIEAGMPALDGLRALHGTATVENAGSRDVMLESANIVVRYRDRELGTARLLLPVEVPARVGPTRVRYDFALDDFSLSSLMTIQSRVLSNPAAFTLDVKGYVRWGVFRKKIEMQSVPLDRLSGLIAVFTTL